MGSKITFFAPLKPLNSKNEKKKEKNQPFCKVPTARIGISALSPLPSGQSIYTLDFWILSNEGWPEEAAFAFFPITGSRRAKQQLPRLPTARAQTAQTWEPVESLASSQTACMSVRGQGGGGRRTQAFHAPASCQRAEG